MSDDRENLRDAATALRETRETTDDSDASERLKTCVERVEAMVAAERGPDHGRLARFEQKLRDVQADLDSEGSELVDEALSHVKAYRETVEGV